MFIFARFPVLKSYTKSVTGFTVTRLHVKVTFSGEVTLLESKTRLLFLSGGYKNPKKGNLYAKGYRKVTSKVTPSNPFSIRVLYIGNLSNLYI